jgi:arginase
VTEALGAVDYPQPGGLDWDQLGELTAAALAVPGCAGWTVAIYNPDLDPGGRQVGRIVDWAAVTAERLAGTEPPG